MVDSARHGQANWLKYYKTILLLLIILLQFYIRTPVDYQSFDVGIGISYLLIGLCCLSFKGQYLRYATILFMSLMSFALIDNLFFSLMSFTVADAIGLCGIPLACITGASIHYYKLPSKPAMGRKEAISIVLLLSVTSLYFLALNHKQFYPVVFNIMGWENQPHGVPYYQCQAFTEILCSVLMLLNLVRLDLLTAIYHLLHTLRNYLEEVAGEPTKYNLVEWQVISKINYLYVAMLLGFITYRVWKSYRHRKLS